MTETIAFLDFETTGLYADHGDRPTEVAVVFVRSQTIVDRFQSLINPGRQIPERVVHLTGITNSMVKNAPSPTSVMRKLHSKLGNIPIVAHNASFDRKFLEKEWSRIGKRLTNDMYCSMRVARRVYRDALNHKLGTLVDHVGLKFSGKAHRAMADAEMAAKLWIEMEKKLEREFGFPQVPFELMCRLQSTKISDAKIYIARFAERHAVNVEQPSAKRTLPPAKKKTRRDISGGILPENRLSKNKKPRDYSKFSVSRKGSGDGTSSENLAPKLKIVTCVTCDGDVPVATQSVHRWVKCPHCGFKTPQTAIIR